MLIADATVLLKVTVGSGGKNAWDIEMAKDGVKEHVVCLFVHHMCVNCSTQLVRSTVVVHSRASTLFNFDRRTISGYAGARTHVRICSGLTHFR
jgi:hypothetical protein